MYHKHKMYHKDKRMKRLIVCCDGTARKEILETNLTNVERISRCITTSHRDGNPQVVYYQPGVGTDLESRFPRRDQATGAGLCNTTMFPNCTVDFLGIDEKIQRAYKFICNNYESSDESSDEIYLIGFSRGAFTVRCIAQLIHDVGLLTKKKVAVLPTVFRCWKRRELEDDVIKYARADPDGSRQNIKIEACAVWDTVSALGNPLELWNQQPTSKDLRFVHSDVCPNINRAFQALALHERRYQFVPIVWRLPTGTGNTQTLQQCWFMGYHADVGGGRQQDTLAYFPLVWIISKLTPYLTFDTSVLWSQATWPWRLIRHVGGDRKNSRSHKLRFHGYPLTVLIARFSLISTAEESRTMPYRLLRPRYRFPRCQFWNNEGFYESTDDTNSQISEGMHYTVRMLLRLRTLGKFEAFDHRENERNPVAPQEHHGEQWKWHLAREDPLVRYQVLEDKMSLFEHRTFLKWQTEELIQLHDNAEPGDEGTVPLFEEMVQYLNSGGNGPVLEEEQR